MHLQERGHSDNSQPGNQTRASGSANAVQHQARHGQPETLRGNAAASQGGKRCRHHATVELEAARCLFCSRWGCQQRGADRLRPTQERVQLPSRRSVLLQYRSWHADALAEEKVRVHTALPEAPHLLYPRWKLDCHATNMRRPMLAIACTYECSSLTPGQAPLHSSRRPGRSRTSGSLRNLERTTRWPLRCA